MTGIPGGVLTQEMIRKSLEELWHPSWRVSQDRLATLRDTDDGICAAENSWSRCIRPAVTILTAGCVHEHVFPSPLCRACADKFLARANNCGYCREIGHECRIEIIREDPHQPAEG